MMKSYTLSQKNAKYQRENSPLYMRLPLVLPEDIDESLRDEIFDVLLSTPFAKLSIPIQTFRTNIARFKNDAANKERSRKNMFVNVGFIQNFTESTEEDSNKNGYFNVFIFGSTANDISKLYKPAIELVYTDDRSRNLKVINKFNIISLSEPMVDVNKYKPKDEEESTIRFVSRNPDEEEEDSPKYSDGPLSAPIGDLMAK